MIQNGPLSYYQKWTYWAIVYTPKTINYKKQDMQQEDTRDNVLSNLLIHAIYLHWRWEAI